eukprot:TRINITY_DN54513_c0_g1_i1.p1 TRINITY_DN54513_c0_g1~~TRINITY_DN54513_c0_g1_i1.p1  ORF type:complete len:357 (+),score=80.87 TRINITY_DN54513_c0_g1_i1:1035-2105(+)
MGAALTRLPGGSSIQTLIRLAQGGPQMFGGHADEREGFKAGKSSPSAASAAAGADTGEGPLMEAFKLVPGVSLAVEDFALACTSLVVARDFEQKAALFDMAVRAASIFSVPPGLVQGVLALVEEDWEKAIKHLSPFFGGKVDADSLIKLMQKCQEAVDELKGQMGGQQKQARAEFSNIMEQVRNGKAKTKDLFEIYDKQGDNNGLISKAEFKVLVNHFNMKLSSHQLNEMFSSVKCGSGSSSKELNLSEFEKALDYLYKKQANGALEALGLGTTQLVIMLVYLVIILILFFVFIFLGIKALALGGSFGAVINSLLPVGAGRGLFNKKPAISKDGSERQAQVNSALDTVEKAMAGEA